ncbi:uncharacterized protein LOC129594250 [Paramacrobiotus metropolitanus]|uniref:uncharacterized protein LOC129594250 n=1 Tax=Paramacrobiotus metropolitanus TaxID=2943436 RepID=UPI0024457CCC|nr:uncharacterized protein LOC129594250 [Paramacrobiotus metropolitanus]
MYPPVTTSTSQVIRTQTFTRKGKVFRNSSEAYSTRPVDGPGPATGKGPGGERYRRTSHNSSWTSRSTGSTGGSTSPSISSPLSRTSSVGSNSASDERPGSAIVRQGALISQNSTNSPVQSRTAVKSSSPPKSTLPPTNASMIPSSPRATKGAFKPFNHKEVVEHMNKAYLEAKKAIDAGHGKVFDPYEDGGAPIEFEPFDWEAFWQERKMKGI